MLDRILFFAEGPLLKIILWGLIIGVILRVVFLVIRIFTAGFFFQTRIKSQNPLLILFRSLFPYHAATMKKPVYTAVRYVFHMCLIVVPIWFSGHVSLWEESVLEWYWTPIPDHWADWMTIVLLGIGAYLLCRRIIFSEIRRNSSVSDYTIIIITLLPFLTGYLYTHGNLDHSRFFEAYMWSFHVFSGEVMLLAVIFLFCKTRMKKDVCVGCAACVEKCPTETLEFNDRDAFRFFKYSRYQCICCGLCVKICPEGAAELRHEIGIAQFFRIFSKENIRSVELATCRQCGAHFAPLPQIHRLDEELSENRIEMDLLNLCSRCKKQMSGKNPKFLSFQKST